MEAKKTNTHIDSILYSDITCDIIYFYTEFNQVCNVVAISVVCILEPVNVKT